MKQVKKKIWTVPTFMAALYGLKDKNDNHRAGKEAGLDHYHLFEDIQARDFFFDSNPVAEKLGFKRGGVKEAIAKTVKACYPDSK